jgi:dethiobiotin synthetase
MDNKTYFITGIGTDVGKTIVSAVVCEALKATYWKPVQSGSADGTDRATVEYLCSPAVKTIPESYVFKAPVSPHLAAELENDTIDISKLQVPKVTGNLVVEGAGGLMVPITHEYLYADWIGEKQLPTIVVSRHYLGSINHTLLTIKQLQQLGVPIAGIIYVGEENKDTEKVIQHFSGGIHVIGRIDWANELTKDFILEQSKKLKF